MRRGPMGIRPTRAAGAARRGKWNWRLTDVKMAIEEGSELQRSLDKAYYKVHSRFGAYVRADARERFRSRSRKAKPMQGPTNRMGLVKDNIYFSVIHSGRDVLIGPARLPRMPRYSGRTVPEILENGGRVTRRITNGFLHSIREDGIIDEEAFYRLKAKEGELATFNYRPHPYMGPAFRENKPELDNLWHNALHAA